MKSIFIALLMSFSALVSANPEVEVARFIDRFYQEFNSSSDPESLRTLFAKSPVFYIGEQPALSASKDFAPKMVELLRESMGINEYPYTGLATELAYVSNDGSATAAVVFKRSKSKKEYQNALCSILSLAKLESGWKIMGWSMVSTAHESRCDWA